MWKCPKLVQYRSKRQTSKLHTEWLLLAKARTHKLVMKHIKILKCTRQFNCAFGRKKNNVKGINRFQIGCILWHFVLSLCKLSTLPRNRDITTVLFLRVHLSEECRNGNRIEINLKPRNVTLSIANILRPSLTPRYYCTPNSSSTFEKALTFVTRL